MDPSTQSLITLNDLVDCGQHIPVTERPNSPFYASHSLRTVIESYLVFPERSHKTFGSKNDAQSSSQVEPNGGLQQNLYDPYVTQPPAMANPSHSIPSAQINPYAREPSSSGNTPYYQNTTFTQPIQYHLYTSLGPHREALLPYQRAAHDFFIPDNLREELQRKSATTLQTLPSMYL
jgi:hypothetical protein